MKFEQLKELAIDTLNPRRISTNSYAGSVAASILAENGKVYTGVCIDTPGSMGFCAEHAAIASMITDGETRIKKAVAVYKDGHVIPPCGRCREFMSQIDDDNDTCEVMVKEDTIVKLHELLPFHNRYK